MLGTDIGFCKLLFEIKKITIHIQIHSNFTTSSHVSVYIYGLVNV